MTRTLLRVLKTIGSALRTGWLILGFTLILLIVGEVGLRLVLTVKDLSLDQRPPAERKIDRLARADAYHGAAWVPAYFEELDKVQPFVWHPYVYWRRPPYQGRYIEVDRDGLRATWHPPPRAGTADPPPVRVFAFGGSTMWGYGARDDYTIPSHLSKLLYEKGYRVEVTNYGQLGYVNTQEVIALLRCIQHGDVPDIALFYDGINEVFSAHQNDAAGIPMNEDNRRVEFNLSRQPQRLLWIYGQEFLTTHLWGFHRVMTGLRQHIRSPADTWPDPKWQQALPPLAAVARHTVQVYESNLATVESLGRRYGFEPLFYWQPNIFSKKHRSPSEQTAPEVQAERVFAYEKAFEDIYRRVRQSEALHGNPRFHNISNLFDDAEEPYYVDATHLSEPGNRLIAAAMVNDLLELIERRRAAVEEPVQMPPTSTDVLDYR